MHLASTALQVWVLQGLGCCWALAGLWMEELGEEVHRNVWSGTVLPDAVEEWMLGQDALLLCFSKNCHLQPRSMRIKSEPPGKYATPKIANVSESAGTAYADSCASVQVQASSQNAHPVPVLLKHCFKHAVKVRTLPSRVAQLPAVKG